MMSAEPIPEQRIGGSRATERHPALPSKPKRNRVCTECRGVAGQHRPWCANLVGQHASDVGLLSQEAEALGDRLALDDPTSANTAYQLASRLKRRAELLKAEAL